MHDLKLYYLYKKGLKVLFLYKLPSVSALKCTNCLWKTPRLITKSKERFKWSF